MTYLRPERTAVDAMPNPILRRFVASRSEVKSREESQIIRRRQQWNRFLWISWIVFDSQ